MSTALSQADPEMAKHEEVARLTRLTGGVVRIHFEPSAYYRGDTAGRGHLWNGYVVVENDDQYVTLDDRLDATLQDQLVSELRRIARLHRELADRVASQ